jgi:hypothetical protein
MRGLGIPAVERHGILLAAIITALVVRLSPKAFFAALSARPFASAGSRSSLMLIVGLPLMNYSGLAYTGAGVASTGKLFVLSPFLDGRQNALSKTPRQRLVEPSGRRGASSISIVLFVATNPVRRDGEMISPQNIAPEFQ